MKKYITVSLMATLAAGFISCSSNNDTTGNTDTVSDKSIVILYDNDVHCGVDGYTKIAGLRNAINKTDTAECIVVSCGDYIQGGNWGSISKGKHIIDLMNAVGYDAVTIGNHEFDFGTSYLLDLMNGCNAPITCVNFGKMSSSDMYYKPYIQTEVAGKKIAFVGVVTPSTLLSEYYAFYDSDGKQLYDLYPNTFKDLTQKAVDDARNAGADYVILLSHLGEQDNGYSSISLINATKDIDIVLDGHTHSVIQDSTAVNKENKTIHFTQTGTQFANIGKLTISKTGVFHTELLPTSSVTYADSRVDAVYDSLKTVVSAVTGEKLGYSDHVLSIFDENGKRTVRKQETAIGNFVADAMRYAMNTDIGMENGGGIRANLIGGDITYGDIINVTPFFNDIVAKEMTGSQIRMLIEEAGSNLPQESGSFLQVSGLRVMIDMSSGKPTVTDIQVEDKATGEYKPIDDGMTYTVSGSSYIFETSQKVTGLKDVTPVIMKDAETLKKYFVEGLHGNIAGHYTSTEGRIVIK